MPAIMTTCIGECAQSGLRQSAYQWACVLVRPENFSQVPPKFKTKIESTARRPVKTEDEPEPLSPCPFCKFEIPESRLDCPSCKNNIPFCLASGKHMIVSDWSQCPECKMACIYTEMRKMLEKDPVCPMCEKNVTPMSVTISQDPEAEFKALASLMKDSGNQEEGDEKASDEEIDAALIN